jgi:peroxiredoxin
VRRLGGEIVSIVPERAQFNKKLAADSSLPFPVLSDEDLSYALSLGLASAVSRTGRKPSARARLRPVGRA